MKSMWRKCGSTTIESVLVEATKRISSSSENLVLTGFFNGSRWAACGYITVAYIVVIVIITTLRFGDFCIFRRRRGCLRSVGRGGGGSLPLRCRRFVDGKQKDMLFLCIFAVILFLPACLLVAWMQWTWLMPQAVGIVSVHVAHPSRLMSFSISGSAKQESSSPKKTRGVHSLRQDILSNLILVGKGRMNSRLQA